MSRALPVLFSLFVHGSIVASGFLLSDCGEPPEEKIYRVSLAEFTPAQASCAPVMQENPGPWEPSVQPVAEPTLETTVVPPPPPPKPVPVVQPQPTPVKPPKPAPSKPPKPQQARREEQPEPQRSAESKGEKAAPTDQTTRAQGPTGSGGGSARRGPSMVGGLSAYAEDAVDQRPTISRRAMPEYPSGARRRNIQGMVVVRLVVDTSGSPQNCAIHSSSPEGVFDDAALRAARKTRFLPGKVNGQPVNTLVMIPYQFTLR